MQQSQSFQAPHSLQDSLFDLPVKSRISPSIYLAQKDELELIIFEHSHAKAAISLQGGHLIAWQPVNQQPVIWLSNQTEFKTGKAIRGGVPICWPWFGPQGKPSHGFARNQLWTLTLAEEQNDSVKVILNLKDNPETRTLWPHSFNLSVEFTLGSTCKIRLMSEGNFDYCAALHSYFVIGDNNTAEAHNLGLHFVDTMNGDQHVVLAKVTPAIFSERIDRVYTDAEKTTQLSDPTIMRKLNITHQRGTSDHGIDHYDNDRCDVVIWNPGAELSKSMADMADDSYQTMACVETGIISNPVAVDNNQHFVEAIISIE